MFSRSLMFFTGALLSLSACFDSTKDTGAIDTASSSDGGGGQDGGGQDGASADDGGGDGGGDGGASASIDSCAWTEIALCFELDSYADTAGWCAEMGAKYDIATSYSDGPCAAGAVGTCAVPYTGASYFPADVTTYFYPEYPYDPMEDCAAFLGTWE